MPCMFPEQVLPEEVGSLGEEDAALAEYSPLVAKLRAHHGFAQHWYDELSSTSAGGATLQQFRWAVSVRHRLVWKAPVGFRRRPCSCCMRSCSDESHACLQRRSSSVSTWGCPRLYALAPLGLHRATEASAHGCLCRWWIF